MNYKALIIIILLGGLSIIATSIYVAISKRDVQVVDNPYEAGLAYDERIRKEAELGWKVDMSGEVKAGGKSLKFGLFDRQGRSLTDARVDCLVSECAHPGGAKSACSYTANGYYECPVVLDKPGCREVSLSVARGGNTMVFDSKISVD